MRTTRFGILVCWSAFLLVGSSGCTSLSEYIHNGFKVGPNYKPAPVPLANDWIDTTDQRKDGEDPSLWWKVFNDPVLDQLICDAYKQNLTLRQAGFRILQARAQQGIAFGSLFPQTQLAQASYTSTATSRQTVNGPFLKTPNFGTYNFGFTLAWEADFWGRYRRTIESANANLDASVADYDDVLVTLVSDVAANYVQMRTLQKRIEYAKKNADIQRETMKIAQARLKVEIKSGELTLDQAITLLKQTEAGIPELEITLRRTTNLICILLGIPPEELQAKLGAGPIPTATPEIAFGIPADLLRRRPDIRRAERHAATQSALIGVAEADFYPRIGFTGTIGYSAQTFKKLFTPEAVNGVGGPTASWQILNYGRILNNVRFQDSRFQELVAAYQNTVLNAQQEVENGIVTYLKAQQRFTLQDECVASATKAEKIAKTAWSLDPTGNFTTVSLIQQNKVLQDDTLAQVKGEIALGLISIYRALGGGWQIREIGCEPGTLPVPIPVEQLPAPTKVGSAKTLAPVATPANVTPRTNVVNAPASAKVRSNINAPVYVDPNPIANTSVQAEPRFLPTLGTPQ